ncbi:hypothetical protein KN1_25590 [Stygiolobus caldivivus]|uniref:Uncharacterized protein n=1 Tax=Stygiolobus caldivivus TaxID=2824673 RepID=A0A8D5U8P0_9CREN|nr:hypothetical protein KN1_25590 [Stygiolobus caldivivus]
MSMNENNVIDNSSNENLIKKTDINEKNRNISNIKRLILVHKDDELSLSISMWRKLY